MKCNAIVVSSSPASLRVNNQYQATKGGTVAELTTTRVQLEVALRGANSSSYAAGAWQAKFWVFMDREDEVVPGPDLAWVFWWEMSLDHTGTIRRECMPMAPTLASSVHILAGKVL